MKLHEYLKQFEGLDLELEVFQQHRTIKECVKPCEQQVKLSSIMKDDHFIAPAIFWQSSELDYFPNKGIVLY